MQIILLLISVCFTGISQLFFRLGMKSFDSQGILELVKFIFTSPRVRGGAICMAIGGTLRLYSLSKVEVSFAYPFLACSFIIVLIGGYFLGENINLNKIIGILCILVGVFFISKS